MLLLFAVVGMTLGFSSCKDECCDCSNSSIYTGEICEDEVPNTFGGWNAAKSAYEASGCDCD